MKYFVVIDTNVLVSALLSSHSDAATVQVVNALFLGEIIPIYNEEIIQEYDEVLHRAKFKFEENLIKILLDSLIDNGINIDAVSKGISLPDQKDLVFYEVVMAKRQEQEAAYLVTGNIKHFTKESFIVTPSEFLDIIKEIL